MDANVTLHIGAQNSTNTAFDAAQRELASMQSLVERMSSSMGGQAGAINSVVRAFEDASGSAGKYESAMLRVSAAAENVQRTSRSALDAIASGSETAATKIASAERALASYVDQWNRFQKSNLPTPEPSPSSGGGGGSEHGGILGGASGLLRNTIQMGGYYLGYQAANQFGQAFGGGLDYQRGLAVTASTTSMLSGPNPNLNDPKMQAYDAYLHDLIAKGQAGGYDLSAVQQGAYPILSSPAGALGQAGLDAILKPALAGSIVTGAPDVSTQSQALVQLLSSYGYRSPGAMKQHAMGMEDILLNAVNLGVVSPSQMAQSVTTFGPQSAALGMNFGDAAGLFSALTYTTRDPQLAAQYTSMIERSAGGKLTKGQQGAVNEAGLQNYFGPDTFEHMDLSTWFKGVSSVVAKDPGKYIPLLFPQHQAAQAFEGLVGQGGSNVATTLSLIGGTSQGGTTQRALDTYNQSPVAKFDEATARFKTAEEDFAKAITPLATFLLTQGTNLITALGDLIKGPGGAGGLKDSVIAAGYTESHYLNPLDKGFMNIDVARKEGGVDYQKYLQTRADEQGAKHYAKRIGLTPGQHFSESDLSVNGADYPSPALADAARKRLAVQQQATAHANVALHNQLLPTYATGHPAFLASAAPDQRDIPGAVGGVPTHNWFIARAMAANAAAGATAIGPTDYAALNARAGGNPASTRADMAGDMARINLAIEQHASKNVVESALGLYEQSVKNAKLGAAGQLDIDAAIKQVEQYLNPTKGATGPERMLIRPTGMPNDDLVAGYGGATARAAILDKQHDNAEKALRVAEQQLARVEQENTTLKAQLHIAELSLKEQQITNKQLAYLHAQAKKAPSSVGPSGTGGPVRGGHR